MGKREVSETKSVFLKGESHRQIAMGEEEKKYDKVAAAYRFQKLSCTKVFNIREQMVTRASQMIPLGTKAFDFKLKDVTSNQTKTLQQVLSEKGLVVVFIRNKCPYVEPILGQLIALGKEYQPKGISFIAINSNDPEMYPDDTAEEMEKFAEKHHFPFPYLDDGEQVAAKGFGAVCTPDFFVFDSELNCIYRGQFDDSRPENTKPVTGKDLKEALECLLSNKKVPEEQYPSHGCRIKWRT